MTERADRAVRVLARILGDGQISARTMATEMGISESQLGALRYGRQRFPAELLPELYAAVAPVDPTLALWALLEISGVRSIGYDLRPAAAGLDADPVTVDALQTARALGSVQGQLADSGYEVDPQEAHGMLPDARRAHRELGQVVGKLERIANSTPQLSLAGSQG